MLGQDSFLSLRKRYERLSLAEASSLKAVPTYYNHRFSTVVGLVTAHVSKSL